MHTEAIVMVQVMIVVIVPDGNFKSVRNGILNCSVMVC